MSKDAIERARDAVRLAVNAHTKNSEYADYVRNVLAGDFAVVLAQMLSGAAIHVPYNVGQAQAWIGVAQTLREVDENWCVLTSKADTPANAAMRFIRSLAAKAARKVFPIVPVGSFAGGLVDPDASRTVRPLLANGESIIPRATYERIMAQMDAAGMSGGDIVAVQVTMGGLVESQAAEIVRDVVEQSRCDAAAESSARECRDSLKEAAMESAARKSDAQMSELAAMVGHNPAVKFDPPKRACKGRYCKAGPCKPGSYPVVVDWCKAEGMRK